MFQIQINYVNNRSPIDLRDVFFFRGNHSKKLTLANFIASSVKNNATKAPLSRNYMSKRQSMLLSRRPSDIVLLVTKPIPSVSLFSWFFKIAISTLAIEHYVCIWQVSPPGLTESNRYFCKIENFAYGEISERSFSNPLTNNHVSKSREPIFKIHTILCSLKTVKVSYF